MKQNLRPFAFVLAVPDIERSAGYFRDALGFRISWGDAPDWRLVERDSVRIMLGECPTDMPAAEIGSHGWFGYLELDDVDAFHAEILARGAISTAPKDQPYQMREIVVTTIDGHRIVFGQRRTPSA